MRFLGIVSAPLWDSRNSTFAGLLTSTDYINVIQYYCQFPDQLNQVDQFRLSSLRGTRDMRGARRGFRCKANWNPDRH